MTAGRAAILKAIDTYRDLNYGLSKIEVQKLGYFLQVAGQDLKLHFEKHTYGPYSEELRHALNRMEGHFIVGLGDRLAQSLRCRSAVVDSDQNTFVHVSCL